MAVPKDPRQLETAEPFVSLFPIVPDELALITRSMRDRGYIKDRPILAWRDAFGVKDRLVVVDGHSRRLAALDAGLSEVTVTLRRFESVDEALLEAIEEQAQRRNLTRSQLVMFVLGALAKLDTGSHGQGARNDLVGRSAQQLADMLGVGRATIERARALLMFGEPDLIDRVKAGEMGLKEAADRARNAGQEKEKAGGSRGRGADDDDLIEAAPEPESEPGPEAVTHDDDDGMGRACEQVDEFLTTNILARTSGSKLLRVSHADGGCTVIAVMTWSYDNAADAAERLESIGHVLGAREDA